MSPPMITRYSRFADQRQLAKAAILQAGTKQEVNEIGKHAEFLEMSER